MRAPQVKELKPDGFEPKIIKQTNDYVYLEYTSPIFGVREKCSGDSGNGQIGSTSRRG